MGVLGFLICGTIQNACVCTGGVPFFRNAEKKVFVECSSFTEIGYKQILLCHSPHNYQTNVWNKTMSKYRIKLSKIRRDYVKNLPVGGSLRGSFLTLEALLDLGEVQVK